jgi:hypothetical protein
LSLKKSQKPLAWAPANQKTKKAKKKKKNKENPEI